MQVAINPCVAEEPCEPEWIALNHLFRYCAKSLSVAAVLPDGQGEPVGDSTRHCARRNCVFSMKLR